MDGKHRHKRKKNFMERANLISKLTFGYTLGLFNKAYKKKKLEEGDIYQVLKSCESKRCGNSTDKLWQRTPSLVMCLIWQFGIQYLLISLIDIAWTLTVNVLSPLGLSKVVAYFTPNQSFMTRDQFYGYASILIFVKVANFLIIGNLRAWESILGVRIQAALNSFLFRKSLKISSSSSETSLGNFVTLVTKDIHILEKDMWIVREFTIFFIEFGTAGSLLYFRIGGMCFVGLGLFVVAVIIQVYLSYKLKNLRLVVGKNSDERLQKTQETLSVMKIIKMYTWEKFFVQKISESRRKEINGLLQVFMINIFIDATGDIVSKIAFIVLIKTYMILGYDMNTEVIFYILQIFNQLSRTFGSILPNNFSKVAQFCASVSRLDKVLHAKELDKFRSEYEKLPFVTLSNVSLDIENTQILRNISINIMKPGLTVVTGPVGSGKTSLLKVILRDYHPITEGYLKVNGNISYASQDPWIFPATVRQNILFTRKYDKQRYDEVVRICALEYDFSLLDEGDQTVLSDRGQNLSKGQQARINLARAVYRDTNIYFLDDSLTALDARVQEYIFHECILKFLRNKIVILVSQNPIHINAADQVILMNGGEMENLDKIHLTENKVSTASGNEKEKIAMEESNETKKRKLSKAEQQQKRINIYKEVQNTGSVELNVFQKYLQYGGGYIALGFIILIYFVAQFCESYGDKILTKWIDLHQSILDLETEDIKNSTTYKNAVDSREYFFAFFGILSVAKSVFHIAKFFAVLWFCRTASIKLHNKMILAITGATMAFFDTHFIGNILNRLSFDLNNVDEYIPFQIPSLGNVIFHTIGSTILITTVNWIFLIPVVLFVIVMVLMRIGVMPAVRSLKRLGSSTRSPLIGHINASLEGLTTVRAFNAEKKLQDEFDSHQDLYNSVTVTLRLSLLGFTFYMDLMSALFVIIVLAWFLFFEKGSSAGNVGLALTQVFKLTSYVELAIRKWTALENNMICVERAVEYTTVKQEYKEGMQVANWPTHGNMSFENIVLCYEGSKTPILKGIQFRVNPKERIGIVGRTGAGKSSIISILYRLYDYEGVVNIDGIDIKTLSLDFLRKNISIIPQDPILFTGTIRENLDPDQQYTDDQLWNIIYRVGLREMIQNLDSKTDSKGSTYSSGQKQMICLARAALKKSKILVLDEATANMDAESDKMVHKLVEEVFYDCTVLMIAHRLHIVMNCDKVLVLDSGNVVEFDDPKSLLKKEDGFFHKMCEEYKME